MRNNKEEVLREVTKDELMEIRINSKTSKTVIKVGDKLYITNMSIRSAFMELGIKPKCPTHLCGKGATCKNMNAGQNGCSLVRSRTFESLKKTDGNIKEKLKKADCIENFDFITLGYEIFNKSTDNKVIVIKCDNYVSE